MTEWIWLNGQIVPAAGASISIHDRGFQLADGVYEVMRIYSRNIFALKEHFDRLFNSARAINIEIPYSREVLAVEIDKLLEKTQLVDGQMYLQVTRGVAPREVIYPDGLRPTVYFTCKPTKAMPKPEAVVGAKVITLPDERWRKCYIKSIALLANVLARRQAFDAGMDEAVLVEEGKVNECGSANIHFLKGNTLLSPPAGPKVLPGISRLKMLQAIDGLGLEIEERHPTVEEAKACDAAFMTGTTREVHWVKQWDEKVYGEAVHPTVKRIHQAFRELIAREMSAPESPATRARMTFGCRG